MIKILDNAYLRLNELRKKHNKKYVRLSVKGGGCAGFNYDWSFSDDEKSITGGNVRGLYWTIPDTTNHEEQRLKPVRESLYTEICPEFKDTYVEEVYNIINKRFKVGRVRFLMKPPRTCLSWHRDPEMRLHIPIITNKGNIMVIGSEAFHMPANGNGYLTDNRQYHNFFNGSEIERVHLVATVLGSDLDEMHLDEHWRDEVKYD